MSKFYWHHGLPSNSILVKQVYGIIFSLDGKILLLKDGQHFSLSGGKPEKYDRNIEETLKRELKEEINVSVAKTHLIGYQLVDDEDGSEPYAQIRMIALIDNIGNKRPDTDNGKMYDRVWVSPLRAIQLLDWGDIGLFQISDAVRIAEKEWEISFFSDFSFMEEV